MTDEDKSSFGTYHAPAIGDPAAGRICTFCRLPSHRNNGREGILQWIQSDGSEAQLHHCRSGGCSVVCGGAFWRWTR